MAAREVIASMREPTEEMDKAAIALGYDCSHTQYLEAMIDAALAEES